MARDTLSRRRFAESVSVASIAASFSNLPLGMSKEVQQTSKPRRVGFVDFNLDNYHSNVFLQALRGPLQSRGYDVAGATGLREEESKAWADKNKITYFPRDEALNEVVDAFMVLAPSNPEVHWELCQRILPFRKPTYVDKTFAPSAAIAHKIFALADEKGTPTQTTSALRYTNVQREVKSLADERIEHMITWGGGGSFDEYAIHPLELMISVMGPEVTAVMRRGTPEKSQLLLEFTGNRTGVVNVFPKTNTPFAASITTAKRTRQMEVEVGNIFVDNMSAILDFFETGKPNVDRRESVVLMAILDAARDPRALSAFLKLE